MKELVELLENLEKEVIQLYNKYEENRKIMQKAVFLQMAGVKDAPEVHLINGVHHAYIAPTLDYCMDKGRMYLGKDSRIWYDITTTKVYDSITKYMRNIKIGNNYETILSDFVHDVIWNIAMEQESLSRNRIKNLVKKYAKTLAENLVGSYPSHSLVAPIHAVEIEDKEIKIGKYAIIRPASYSENREYSLGFSNKTGIKEFKYILQISTESLVKGKFGDTIQPNLSLLASIILALRLEFGGGIGTNFTHYWIMIDDENRELGNIHQIGESEIIPSRALKPGLETSIIKKAGIRRVIELVERLYPLQTLEQKTFLSRALRRFGNAGETRDPIERIIESITGLECLFGGYSKKVILMGALMLSNKSKPKTKIKALISDCYSARNKLAHGSSYEKAEKKARGNLEQKSKELVDVLRNCILIALDYQDDDWKKLSDNADIELAKQESEESISEGKKN